MKSNEVASVLKREKELLEHVLELAECQIDLLESGRAEDLETLLSLRAEPMSELAFIEETMETDTQQILNDSTLNKETLEEIESLNIAILSLADRIVNLDEKAESLAEECEDCVTPDSLARAEAGGDGGRF
jgi:hypothetical protein